MSMWRVGARVRLIAGLDAHNVGLFPAHTAGTVIDEDLKGLDGVVAVVLLDQHFSDLDEWDNRLYVYDDDSPYAGEIVKSLFEPDGF